MKNLKSRIKHLEKQLSPPPLGQVFLVYSKEEANQIMEKFKREFPEQPEPMILVVGFVNPGDLEKENENV